MAIQWSDNCYRHADFHAGGKIVNTARPGNTSCRAPGVVQGVLLHELAMEHAAEACGLAPEELREKNLYAPGDHAPDSVRICERSFDPCSRTPPSIGGKAACWSAAAPAAGSHRLEATVAGREAETVVGRVGSSARDDGSGGASHGVSQLREKSRPRPAPGRPPGVAVLEAAAACCWRGLPLARPPGVAVRGS